MSSRTEWLWYSRESTFEEMSLRQIKENHSSAQEHDIEFLLD